MATVKWNCPYCDTEYEIDKKYEAALKDKENCKFCVRKDPNVPTTAEMDGLLTQQDMRDRFFVMLQCTACLKWTKQDQRQKTKPCSNPECGRMAFDSTSIKSLRTYDPERDNKRKIKATKGKGR